MVAIFDIFSCFMRTPCPEVDAEHRLRFGEFAPFYEFVCSKGIGFRAQPGEIKTPWPFIFRAHAVLPVAARHIVASRIANDCWAQFSHDFKDVLAKAMRVRCRVARFKNAGVDTPSHVFNERAKKATVELGNAEIRIDDYSGFFIHGKVVQNFDDAARDIFD